MTTKFVSEILNKISQVAYRRDKTTFKLTQQELFANMDEVFDLVEADIDRILVKMRDIEEMFDDYIDCGDWQELHYELDTNDQICIDLVILKSLGTPNYANKEHYGKSLDILIDEQVAQNEAYKEGSPLFNAYYIQRLSECIAEICQMNI